MKHYTQENKILETNKKKIVHVSNNVDISNKRMTGKSFLICDVEVNKEFGEKHFCEVIFFFFSVKCEKVT